MGIFQWDVLSHMALIKNRGSIVDQAENYCVLTSLCYRLLYIYKNIIFYFLCYKKYNILFCSNN